MEEASCKWSTIEPDVAPHSLGHKTKADGVATQNITIPSEVACRGFRLPGCGLVGCLPKCVGSSTLQPMSEIYFQRLAVRGIRARVLRGCDAPEGGGITTQGGSMDELQANVREAVAHIHSRKGKRRTHPPAFCGRGNSAPVSQREASTRRVRFGCTPVHRALRNGLAFAVVRQRGSHVRLAKGALAVFLCPTTPVSHRARLQSIIRVKRGRPWSCFAKHCDESTLRAI